MTKQEQVVELLKEHKGTFKMVEIVAYVQGALDVGVGIIRKAVAAVAVKNGKKRGTTWTIS